MLQTLSIKQFAIIDELDINFSDGLTVMSGLNWLRKIYHY